MNRRSLFSSRSGFGCSTNKSLNILLINHYAGSRVHGMEYRPYYFAREWVRSGHNVTIVAATESHVRTLKPAHDRALTEECIDGIRYVWLKTPRYSGNGPGRVRNMFSFVVCLMRSWRQIVGANSPNVVIASSTYPLDIYPARRIARTTGARLIFEVHDLWPLSPIELGGMSRRNPFIMLLQHAEDTAYRSADYVVSLLPRTREYMVSRGMTPEKWRWIPNGIDTADWTASALPLPDEHKNVIAAAKNRGSFLVGYAGGHGVSNGLDTLIDAATGLESCPIEIVMVGHGPEKARLQARARSAQVHFLPSIPKTGIPALLDSMDALYLGFRDEPLYRFGVCPNKLMDYMMAGKPVIYAINGHDDSVDTARCGVTIPAEDPAALTGAIISLSRLPAEERGEMGARGRQYVLANHQYSVLAGKFLEAIA